MSSAAHAAQQEAQIMESLFGVPSNAAGAAGCSNIAPPIGGGGMDKGSDEGESLGSQDSTHDSEDEDEEPRRVDNRHNNGDSGVINLSEARPGGSSDRGVRRAPSGSSHASRRVRPRSDPRGRALSSMIFNNAFGVGNVASTQLHAETGEEDDEEEEDGGRGVHDAGLYNDGAEDVDEFVDDEPDDRANDNDIEQSLFRVAGVQCVGCALDPYRLAKVDQFVLGNAAHKQSDALWRLAEGVYEATVVKPCRRERSVAPNWTWQDIRSHYLEHVVSDKLVRLQTCRELGAMRRILVSQMVAVNDETGAQELDKTVLEQYMKVVTTESREHSLLTSAENAQQKAASGNSKYGSSIVPTGNAASDDL